MYGHALEPKHQYSSEERTTPRMKKSNRLRFTTYPEIGRVWYEITGSIPKLSPHGRKSSRLLAAASAAGCTPLGSAPDRLLAASNHSGCESP